MVRVLHVITDLGLGGAESMLCALLTRAPAAGIEARVVSLMAGGENRALLETAGIPVSDLAMNPALPRPGAVRDLARLVRRTAPDVVQGWMYHADLAATAALALVPRRARPLLVWGVRCSDMDGRRHGWRLRRVIGLCARFSGRPAAVIANSQAGRRVHEALGYHPPRFEVVPNGIDAGLYRPDPAARAAVRAELGIAPEAPLLAHLARLDPMKDHGTFLAALDRLPGVSALAVGKGTEGLPARPGLYRLGARTDTPRLLAAADLIVNSSAYGEGFSNALAEGMAAGLPAVATDVGDARLILGRTGRIVPPRDADALAAAVRELLAVPAAACRAQAAAARARIEAEFPLSRAAARFAAIYRELLAAPCAASSA